MQNNLKPSAWRRIALPASLALNLFLVAAIGGHVWRAHHDTFGAHTPLARALANAYSVLDQRDAAAFRAVMQRDEPRLGEAAAQIAQTRKDLQRALTAEPFDKEAARRALVAWRASGGHFLDNFGDTLIDALAQVSPEGRRKLVDGRRAD
jgi:uncharacterized membrane protein